MSHEKESHEVITQVEGAHVLEEEIQVIYYVPDHEKRAESAKFRHTKHHMVNILDLPCFICGSKEGREVHHNTIEWCYASAVDWSEGSKIRQDFPQFDWPNFKDPTDFVDDEINMVVLCKKHHTGKDHGIHYVPRPVWILQRYKRDDFPFSPDELKKLHEQGTDHE